MTADIVLLPCPFCGGKASMRHNYQWWVECVSCGVDTPDSVPMDEDGAAAAWNTRANVAHVTAAKDAEIERLRAEVATERGRREHTQQWYAVRNAKIEDVAKREGLWPEVAAIFANGSGTRQLPDGSYFYDPPTYAQQLNIAKHRATAAEARAERLAEALRGLLVDAVRRGMPEDDHSATEAQVALRDHDQENSCE